jgi:hypothetical protein
MVPYFVFALSVLACAALALRKYNAIMKTHLL